MITNQFCEAVTGSQIYNVRRLVTKFTQIGTIVSFLLFLIITVWSVTVTGILEPAQVNVPHFAGGAGNMMLLFRVCLAFLVSFFLVLSLRYRKNNKFKFIVMVIAITTWLMFLFSCFGLERWSSGFSESEFDKLKDQYFAEERVTEAQVFKALGTPLCTGTNNTGDVIWSYSYMPSGGFGWNKRIFWLRGGVVTYMYEHSEP